eukprot:scaffold97702_cov50-Cyclotella_meneghiniana.AAC.1
MMKRLMEASKTNSGNGGGRGGNNTQTNTGSSNKRQKKNKKETNKEAEESNDDDKACKVDLMKKGSVMTRVRGSIITIRRSCLAPSRTP